LRKSSWMHDKLNEKLEDYCNSSANREHIFETSNSEKLVGIVAFFILPTGSNKVLRRVSREEFLPFLNAQSTSITSRTIIKIKARQKSITKKRIATIRNPSTTRTAPSTRAGVQASPPHAWARLGNIQTRSASSIVSAHYDCHQEAYRPL
jgi:hypothetical protein